MLKAGTKKDYGSNRRYHGVIRDYGYSGNVIWTCEHDHSTSREALGCASTELKGRV